MSVTAAASLNDRLSRPAGRFYLPGITALVRLIADQRRCDNAAGLRTRSLVTGYPGSPLAGLDLQLARDRDLLAGLGVVHQPAAAEERAATALMGSQMLDNFPHVDCDGVVGYWYGKGPGVDRSGDALRHGNFAGTSRLGGVVVLSGEDHEASSSTMPFQEEYAFESAGIPILYPATVEEFHALGLHAVALSRYSGCWIALKLVTQLCDGGAAFDVAEPAAWPPAPALDVDDGRTFVKRTDFTFFPGRNIDTERALFRERHAAVLAYARQHQLNRIVGGGKQDRIGIVAAGKSYADFRQALSDIGIDDARLIASKIRLLKIGLCYPLDTRIVADFAAGLEQIIVVEEKRDFLERQVKAALLDAGRPVPVHGKNDARARPLLPVEGGFDADTVVTVLGSLLEPYLGPNSLQRRQSLLAEVAGRTYSQSASRTPNYCSGCPHNLSTRLPEGKIAWGSPGCHSFATVMEQPHRHIEAMTQLGGEGLPWIGLAPFTTQRHMVQNVGDGSLWHSAYDNIRACVAAGVNITFKVLYNGVVANTGAQSAPGARSIPELTRLLADEGVSAVALLTKEPQRYHPRRRLGSTTTVHRPEDIISIQQQLERRPGVTVLIYDESCANERRRQRKRGLAPAPEEYVFINDRVCENCGDCGAKSNCMSLQKHPTVFGDKTHIHTSSCNQDYSCLEGDCPSFVTVRVTEGTGYRRRDPAPVDPGRLPEPAASPLTTCFRIHAPGVGGTGVITLNAILAVAATSVGLEVSTYDQTGAAQKWGPVLSSLTVAPAGTPLWSNKVGAAAADLCLGLDLAAATSPGNLDRYSPQRTAAVLNVDVLPTGEMVRDVWAQFDVEAAVAQIRQYTRSDAVVTVPARTIAEQLFGDYLLTNMVAVGAAYQAGLLPIPGEAIEAAIRLNGVAVDRNLQAFRYGRLWIADPDSLAEVLAAETADPIVAEQAARQALSAARGRAADALLDRARHLPGSTRELLTVRVLDLIDYQNNAYATDYLDTVLAVAAKEATVSVRHDLTEAVIKGLHKLLAYKDEYEVARLYRQQTWREQLAATFDSPVKASYRLHPPLLRSLGVHRKVELGPWFDAPLAMLQHMKGLRGTRLDPFGHTKARRLERELVVWYRDLIEEVRGVLTTLNYDIAMQIAELPDRIRGYEGVKEANANAARAAADQLRAALQRPPLPLTVRSSV